MRILVEILRQPELFTKICGSYLKGDQDPAYDDYVDMTKQVKQKRTKTKKITDEQVLQFQLNFNALQKQYGESIEDEVDGEGKMNRSPSKYKDE